MIPLAVALAMLAGAGGALAGDLSWSGVKSFVYQLQGIDPGEIAAFDCDLAIVDHSTDGSAAGVFTTQQVERMKRGGRPKKLLAYMSIGEAEEYRFYWKKGWRERRPEWLGEENPDWPGNYRVKFWHPDWQAVVMDYLDRIVTAGFDGVYLDIVDGYEAFEETRPAARREMVELVQAIAAAARRRRPDFGVFGQNALELIEEPGYLDCITGAGKESTWFTWGDREQAAGETREQEALMARVVRAGKLVLATDYCRRPANIARVKARARQMGVLSYCTTRELNRLFMQ